MKKSYAAVLGVLLFCGSCGDLDLFDSDKWSDKIEGWEPDMTLPVAYGSFTVWDLINQGISDTSYIQKGSDSVLYIQYTKKDIYNVPLDLVFDLSGTAMDFTHTFADLSGSGIPSDGITPIPDEVTLSHGANTAIDLPVEFSGTQLSGIEMENGTLSYSLPDVGFNYEVIVTYNSSKTATVQETELLRRAVVGGVGLINGSVSLKNLYFHLDNNLIGLNLKIVIAAGGIYNGSDFTVGMTFDNGYQFRQVFGKIKKTSGIQISGDPFDMDIDFLNEIGGNFVFTNPQIDLTVKNKGIGMPVNVDMRFYAKDGNGVVQTMKLDNGKTLAFQGNSDTAHVKSFVQSITTQNSNIAGFLSMPPKGDISYDGDITLNPEGAENSVYRHGWLNLDAYVKIPLKLTATGLSYQDTISDIDVGSDVSDKIKSASIGILVTENGIPMALEISSLVLLKDDYTVLTEVKASEVDGKKNDKLEAMKSGLLEYRLTEREAALLPQMKHILLNVKASTGNEPVELRCDARLKLKVRVQAQGQITDL